MTTPADSEPGDSTADPVPAVPAAPDEPAASGPPAADAAPTDPADAAGAADPSDPPDPAKPTPSTEHAESAESAESAKPGAPEEPAAPAVTAAPRRAHRWLRVLAACVALAVLALAGGLWYVYQHLNANITTDTVTETELKAQESQRPTEGPTTAENILLIGSDNRGNGNQQYGQDSGTQRSDTTILLHLSADRTNATAMSIPRDLMTHVPQCTKPDGSTISPTFEQFNWAFEAGGAACTIRAVEQMTGVRIGHHLIVDFNGFKNMVNAIDGVDVCVPQPIHDVQAHLDLPAGRQNLNGEQALGYVRVRHSLGDGSDTERIQRQQDFLASLIKKVQGNGVLLNPIKLYPLLNAATKSLTADPGLDSLTSLYKLAQSLQKVPTGAIHFLTVPREPYTQDHNRDQLVQPDAGRLFAAIQADVPVNVTTAGGSADGGTAVSTTATTAAPTTPTAAAAPSGTATPTAGSTPTSVPTFPGTTADRDICGKVR